MELGAIISQKRKQAGLTIDELAERSGVPKGTLNKIINGYTRDPQIETVKSIARALDCTLDGCIAKMAKNDKSINTTYFRQLVR